MSRRVNGFTLIELLIVIVIVGILASIAIGKYRSIKEKAFVATMRSDLHNLTNAQESFYADSATYYGGSVPSPLMNSRPSNGVTIALSNVSVGGWAASASHSASAMVCAVFHGTASPVTPASTNGEVACR